MNDMQVKKIWKNTSRGERSRPRKMKDKLKQTNDWIKTWKLTKKVWKQRMGQNLKLWKRHQEEPKWSKAKHGLKPRKCDRWAEAELEGTPNALKEELKN